MQKNFYLCVQWGGVAVYRLNNNDENNSNNNYDSISKMDRDVPCACICVCVDSPWIFLLQVQLDARHIIT